MNFSESFSLQKCINMHSTDICYFKGKWISANGYLQQQFSDHRKFETSNLLKVGCVSSHISLHKLLQSIQSGVNISNLVRSVKDILVFWLTWKHIGKELWNLWFSLVYKLLPALSIAKIPITRFIHLWPNKIPWLFHEQRSDFPWPFLCKMVL